MGQSVRFLAILGLTIGFIGCQTFNVRSDWDSEASFANLHRYFWVEPPVEESADPFVDNSLLRKRVHSALEVELNKRGFESTHERDDADFLVTYSIILEERIKVDGYSGAGGYYRGGYGGYGHLRSAASVRSYKESTLIIDFLDPNNDDLLWRGWGVGIVRPRDRDRNRERARARLEKGVEAILQAFPPAQE